MNTIHFKTPEAAALWEQEILGQLSDGAWENTSPDNHWRPWFEAEVILDGQLGHTDKKIKTGYNLYLLKDYVLDRMQLIITYAKLGYLNRLKELGIKDYANIIANNQIPNWWRENSMKKYYSDTLKIVDAHKEELDKMMKDVDEHLCSVDDVTTTLYEIKKAMTTRLD